MRRSKYNLKGGYGPDGVSSYQEKTEDGIDYDPQLYSHKKELIAKLNPEASQKLLAATLRARSQSYDPSMNGGLRESYLEQAAALDGGQRLYDNKMTGGGGMRFDNGGVPPSMGGGGAKTSSFMQSPQAAMAKALMRERKDETRADADYAYEQKMKNLDLQQRQQETSNFEEDQRKQMLMKVLGMLR